MKKHESFGHSFTVSLSWKFLNMVPQIEKRISVWKYEIQIAEIFFHIMDLFKWIKIKLFGSVRVLKN